MESRLEKIWWLIFLRNKSNFSLSIFLSQQNVYKVQRPCMYTDGIMAILCIYECKNHGSNSILYVSISYIL